MQPLSMNLTIGMVQSVCEKKRYINSMLSLETIFSIANVWVLPGWLLLVFARSWKYTRFLIFYLIIVFLAITYAWMLLSDIGSFDPEAGSSLSNLALTFSNERVALVGWIHYLAFDMLAGLMIAMDGKKTGIHPALMFLPLFFTLMTGPFGLLIYTVIRYFYKGKAGVPLGE